MFALANPPLFNFYLIQDADAFQSGTGAPPEGRNSLLVQEEKVKRLAKTGKTLKSEKLFT